MLRLRRPVLFVVSLTPALRWDFPTPVEFYSVLARIILRGSMTGEGFQAAERSLINSGGAF